MWFRKDVRWDHISYINNLPDDFVLKYKLRLNFEAVFQYSNLKEETLEKLALYLRDKEWYYLWDEQKVSEQFIERHLDKVNWDRICITSDLSEDFIRRHIDKVDWESICCAQNLSESFLREYWDQVFWYDILMFHDNLTPEFVREIVQFASKNYKGQEPLIENLSNNTKVDKKIFREYEDQLNWLIIGNENYLTEEEVFRWSDKVHWTDVIAQQHLSFPSLKKYLRSLKKYGKWEFAFKYYTTLPEDFIEQYISKKTHNSREIWKSIWQDQLVSEQFIRRHIDKVENEHDWYCITHNPNISIQFYKDFKDYIIWDNFIIYEKNEQFIRELIEACPEKINWEKLDYSDASLDFVHTYWNKLNLKSKWYCWSYVKQESGFEGDRILPKDDGND